MALPAGDTGATECAILSLFVEDSASGEVKESPENLFLVQWWISYDICVLSAATPNAAPRGCLSVAQQNDASNAVDLAVGRRNVRPSVTGCSAASVREQHARSVFKHVALPAGDTAASARLSKYEMRDIGQLCLPLWSFPFLGPMDFDLKFKFFGGGKSKWDVNEWLVLPNLKLY